jgi:hypothetical protein
MKNRFILQESKDKGYWVLTDTLNNIVCKFKEKAFNETQEFTLLEDIPMPNASDMAQIFQEMGAWICNNHPTIV